MFKPELPSGHRRSSLHGILLFVALFYAQRVNCFPNPIPLFTPVQAQNLLPLVNAFSDSQLQPCWEVIINSLQLSSSLFFAADGARIVSLLASNRSISEPEALSGKVLSSTALAELSAIQGVLAIQGFKRWHSKAPLTPGARYIHALTTSGSGAGLLIICTGVASGDFWVTAGGNVAVVIFFLAEAVTTRWRDPQLRWIDRRQIITGNLGGMLFAASSFAAFSTQDISDAVLATGLLVLSAALTPTTLLYFTTLTAKMVHRLRSG
ncbi:MAG: hypothetical protein ACR2PX_09320 [Endozoicomonas sp.]|uniref:hypothetical protein n=1 Tax=Endozoicomonas sp. TaxID=1892382 RepID=UPI003D9AB610